MYEIEMSFYGSTFRSIARNNLLVKGQLPALLEDQALLGVQGIAKNPNNSTHCGGNGSTSAKPSRCDHVYTRDLGTKRATSSWL